MHPKGAAVYTAQFMFAPKKTCPKYNWWICYEKLTYKLTGLESIDWPWNC